MLFEMGLPFIQIFLIFMDVPFLFQDPSWALTALLSSLLRLLLAVRLWQSVRLSHLRVLTVLSGICQAFYSTSLDWDSSGVSAVMKPEICALGTIERRCRVQHLISRAHTVTRTYLCWCWSWPVAMVALAVFLHCRLIMCPPLSKLY